MSVYSVRLRPRGAFHLGERGIGYEETSELVHADTLFGALCSVWGLLYGEKAVGEDLLPNGPGPWEPPFLFASAFPRAGSVRFYPKPLLPPPHTDPAEWKEVRWISEDLFVAWLRRTPLRPAPDRVHGGTVALTEDECETLRRELPDWQPDGPLWKVARVPRVTLDVATHASELWHFGRLHFGPECGLHLWVDVRRLDDRLWTALRLLGDVGLGGDRSAGHGLFDLEFSEETPPWPASDTRFVTLSPVYPCPPHAPNQVAELLKDGCAYRLLTRTGWIGTALATPYRRKAVRLIEEGSVLTGSTHRVWGGLADVTPDQVPDLPHRVYRWGYAFPAGVS
jgi:CRISPR-associated protein Csm4